MSEVEEVVKRLMSLPGVVGLFIMNCEGIPIRSTLDHQTMVQYAGLIHNFNSKARSVIKEIDSSNELRVIRIRSRRNEIIIVPAWDYALIVVQSDLKKVRDTRVKN